MKFKMGIPGKKKITRKLNRALAGKLSPEMMSDVFGVVSSVVGNSTVAQTIHQAIIKSLEQKAVDNPEITDPNELIKAMNYGDEMKIYQNYGVNDELLNMWASVAIDKRNGEDTKVIS